MDTTYVTRDQYGMYAGQGHGLDPGIMGIDTLVGNGIYNAHGDGLGDIKDFMVDMATGRITFALVSFSGLPASKLFAVPWSALVLDANRHRFLLHITADVLKNAPGFDKEEWPSMIDPNWIKNLHKFYGTTDGGL
jgi:PRC-barrel domain